MRQWLWRHSWSTEPQFESCPSKQGISFLILIQEIVFVAYFEKEENIENADYLLLL